MRKVLFKKYKYSYKDIFRWLGILFLHFLAFYAFIMIMLGLKSIYSGIFFPRITELNWGILYPMSLGPVVSTILHIVYVEKGNTNIKAALWLHSIIITILTPIVIFVI